MTRSNRFTLLLCLALLLAACGGGAPTPQAQGTWETSTWDTAAWQ
ncbi:hypothetical protein [Deinococcus taeanensis]|nr:hypothetical protein [Deinococcus taeanensis]